MKPPTETLRINRRGRDQLIKVKRSSGIEHWNVICRWAFCLSIREPSLPPPVHGDTSSEIEISWRVFTGADSDLYCALSRSRFQHDTKAAKDLSEAELFRRHIHRGLTYLDTMQGISGIADFIKSCLRPVSG